MDLQNDVMMIACFLVPKGIDIQVTMTNSLRRYVKIECAIVDVTIEATKMQLTKVWPEPVVSIHCKKAILIDLEDAALITKIIQASIQIAEFTFRHRGWLV